jgi:hypothetical protein
MYKDTLKQLVRESLYVVDEEAVARAILLRATLRAMIPGARFPSDLRTPPVRSFRRTRDARSFRPVGFGAPLHG